MPGFAPPTFIAEATARLLEVVAATFDCQNAKVVDLLVRSAPVRRFEPSTGVSPRRAARR